MKKYLLAFIAVFTSFLIQAQTKDYKVVFDMTSADSVNQKTVVREIGLIQGVSPEAQLEVVIYGEGLSFVLKDRSLLANQIIQMLNNKNVSVKVCAITMKRNNVDAGQLLPGIQVVPDGIYEIISKQHAGWGYIKVAH
jgi:uncharacterized protein